MSRKKRGEFHITEEERAHLEGVARSRSESASRVLRARILLGRADGAGISVLARANSTSRKLVERTVDRAAAFGCVAGLDDLARTGRPRKIDSEARAWVVSLACRQPKELGLAAEMWTQSTLATYVRENCVAAGHPSLRSVVKGTVNKILNGEGIKPHKIKYYLERRDPDFEEKLAVVLHLHKDVMLENEAPSPERDRTTVSYDEKPGIQALAETAPTLPPAPGGRGCLGRDYEYRRLGTLSILAGVDLHTGHVHHLVERKHGSDEFIKFLKALSGAYPEHWRIRLLLDNHSVHKSRQTQKFLESVPGRFEFVFTPKHASWLNVIEMVFSKMSRSFLRQIRVRSLKELRERIDLGIAEMNRCPQVFRWTYRMDEIEADTAPDAAAARSSTAS